MAEKSRLVTFVVVTYQSRDTIDTALQALRESWARGLAECVVVDNASDDGTADFVAAEHSWAQILRSSVNSGFGRGCNLGFQHVETPYVFFVNPDAQIDAAAVSEMVAFMERESDVGVVGPAIVEGDGELQQAGLMTTPVTLLCASAGCRRPYRQARQIHPGGDTFRTSWICGALMLIRSDLFSEVGGFDPRFFLYFEETDLCRRISRTGSSICAMGQAVARHNAGHSARSTRETLTSNCISEHYYQSRFYYLIKHFGWMPAVTAEFTAFAVERLRFTIRRVMRRPVNQTVLRPVASLMRRPSLPDERC